MIVDLVIEKASINYVIDFYNYDQEEQQKEDQKKLGKVNNNWLSFFKINYDWSNENNKSTTLIDFIKSAELAERF